MGGKCSSFNALRRIAGSRLELPIIGDTDREAPDRATGYRRILHEFTVTRVTGVRLGALNSQESSACCLGRTMEVTASRTAMQKNPACFVAAGT